jgi:hypothetical protein
MAMVRLNKNVKFLTMQREARLNKLKDIGPFITGSMVMIAHTCGNKEHCKCSKGEKHENYYLTYKVKNKTKTKYIPVAMEEEVRKWTLEYKRLKGLMKEISELGLKILKQYGIEKKAMRKDMQI